MRVQANLFSIEIAANPKLARIGMPLVTVFFIAVWIITNFVRMFISTLFSEYAKASVILCTFDCFAFITILLFLGTHFEDVVRPGSSLPGTHFQVMFPPVPFWEHFPFLF